MEAFLKNYRQSPRKVRVVANTVKGKRVPDALIALGFTVKRASDPIAKLIHSAAANASHNQGVPVDMLVVKSITVNKGIVMKRIMPRARGSASRINKRTAQVHVVLADVREGTKVSKAKAVKAVTASKKEAAPKAPAKRTKKAAK